MTMPQMDGEECFNELHNYDPNVRVIISSGYSEEDIQQKFFGKGIIGFIQKPYNLGALRDTLKKVYVN
jgi:two-component system, cell cycle sensor histidine kinase and response regulator CckA